MFGSKSFMRINATTGPTQSPITGRVGVASRLMSTLACVLALAAADGPHAQGSDYIVRPKDVLRVTVLNEPDLSGKFIVEADGTFTFPIVGRVPASGMVLRDVEDTLKHRLGDGYLNDPQLSVGVDEYRIAMVHVMGEVRQAGSFPLTGDMTLIGVLARAGSMTERAGAVAVITRRHEFSPTRASSATREAPFPPEVMRIDLKSLQIGSIADVPLQDGDAVFVPGAESIYVVGEVRNPGTYVMADRMTVLQAVALAGGLTERGSLRRTRIVRQVEGRTKQLKVKADESLRAGDTIAVGVRLF
jgi:polysaccharide export outer membrane protein